MTLTTLTSKIVRSGEIGDVRAVMVALDRGKLSLRGIIDQDVNALIVLPRLGHHPPYRGLIAQISWNGQSVREF